jgi:signal transduction histidine kinase/CheY-like chemotaxis protein
MTGQVNSTPAEQVSVDAPARRVRRMARAQAAIIGIVSMLLGIEGLLVPMIPPDERLPAYAVLIGLMSLGGIALGLFDFAVGRNLARLVGSATEFRRTAAERAAELAQLNADLRHRDRRRSELFATMSHELRTPLNAILGFSRVLLDGIDGDLNAAQRDDVLQIHDGGKGLLGVVNGVLDLARLESGAASFVEEEVAVESVVEDVLGLLRPLAHARRLTISSEVDADLPRVVADEERLRQCLVNLVGNAIKFTERGSVTVRASRHDRMVSIDVADTGIGIAPGAQELIFQPFRQAEQANTRRYGGTGLGLAIVRQTAGMMHGRVSVESEVGVGSTFHLALPIAKEAGSDPGSDNLLPEHLDVLIMSDRQEARQLARALGHENCTAAVASGDAWRQLRYESEAGLAVIDLLLPRAGAWRLLTEFHADAVGRRPRAGLFAVANGVGRVVTPETFDLLAEPALDSQFGSRLDTLLRAHPNAQDGPIGPVVVASADPVWRGRVAVLLARDRHAVVEAGSVAKAVAAARDRRVSALVVDVQLPGPGAASLMAQLNDDALLRSLPLMLIAPATLSPSQQRDLHLATVAWLNQDGRPMEDLAGQIRGAFNRTGGGLVRVGGR